MTGSAVHFVAPAAAEPVSGASASLTLGGDTVASHVSRALRGSPAPLAENAKASLEVRVAPLTITANPQQPLFRPTTMQGILWHWYDEPWSDPKIGSGTWAVQDYSAWIEAVRVRLRDDWPVLDKEQFSLVLSEARQGHRLPTLQDWDRVKGELASAPIGPTEDLAATVTAQLGGIAS